MSVDWSSKIIKWTIEEVRVFDFVLFFNFHVHKHFYTGLNLVDDGKAVQVLKLSFFLFEKFFIVAINFFVWSDFNAKK